MARALSDVWRPEGYGRACCSRHAAAVLALALLLACAVAGGSCAQTDPAQAALQILCQHLDDDSATLSILVAEWGTAVSLPADSLQARAQALAMQIQEMLKQPACQEMLKQRWAAAQETKEVNARRAHAFLQELAKSTGAALSRPDEYTLKSLVESAALKKGLSSWQAGCALRVAVDFHSTGGIARAPIDTLYLQVLSREALDLVPGILDSHEQAVSYHKYWHILGPDLKSRRFAHFFLDGSHKDVVRNLAAEELIAGRICRAVVRPPVQAPLDHPLLTLYATFFIPEAYGQAQRSSFEIGQYRGMPQPASKRRVTRHCLTLHQRLKLKGSLQPIWEDLGAVALKVTEYGPHPGDSDGTGPRTYPVKVEYQESIIEPVFIEFLREKLCPAVR